jgi:hypothetical protein
MVSFEIGSPQLDLMYPLFYAQSGMRVPTISIGKFRSNFIKFEAFEV